jgi:Ni/Fe-hydrogenase subunit HybB-like protein
VTNVTAVARRNFYPAVFWMLMAGGLYATWLRVTSGLGAVTNLSDHFPWGLWVGFDILCGVGLAAGGFTLCAIVHIFNLEQYKPILRPAILTAFLGYVFVVLALMFDLGRPDRIWHPLVMGNPHSVLFEVAMCVMFYSTVLALEFSPAIFERFGWKTPLKVIHTIGVPLIILGVILSTLHQSSLGSLYLIVPHKLHPLWYTPMLPIFFYLSAIMVGLAMTIFESWHSSRSFGKALEFGILRNLGAVLAVVTSVYITFRFADLARRGALKYLLENRMESYLFGLEISLLLLPALLLFRSHIRNRPAALYICSLLVVLGFIANRLNIAITGVESASGVTYVPKWTEVVVTLSIIAAGFAIFRFAAKHLPVFSET